MAYSRDAFPKDQRETSKRLERDKREGQRLERDGAKPDGLTQTCEIASKHKEWQRGDMELFRQLDNRQTN